MAGGQKEIGDRSQNYSGMCRQWMTQHKVPRTVGCMPKTKASGKKSLEKYMNGPHHFKKSPTRGIKVVKTAPKERETYSKLAELAANDEKQEDEERHDINKLLKQLCKERKEEDEARGIVKETQINLEEAQARASATEQIGRFDEYMADVDRGTSGDHNSA